MKTYNRVCRGCNQEVTLEIHNQRYCVPCREAKEAAALAARTKVCDRCNEVEVTRYGVCEACHEAKERERLAQVEQRIAARLARLNARGGCVDCGGIATDPRTERCETCHTEYRQKVAREARESRKQAFWAAQREQEAAENQAAEEEERQLAARFARLSSDAKLLVLLRLGSVPEWLTRAQDIAEPVTPEEVPHDDQDAIDDAFRGLMDGLDL